MTAQSRPLVRRIVCFSLTTSDAARLMDFYAAAFASRWLSSERLEGTAFERLMQVDGGAQRHRLSMGNEVIELLEFDHPGAAYPRNLPPSSPVFQHFAIVVGHMERALDQLSRTGGWTAISSQGPQHLPHSAGGVTAFKFRDPDGHPLEFIAFPADRVPKPWRRPMEQALFCGIAHSAISVRNTEISVAFYEELGLKPTSHSLNHGIEQELLDGFPEPHVEVTALVPPDAPPHLELLCYEAVMHRSVAPARGHDMTATQSQDVAATRLVLAVDPGSPYADNSPFEALVVDPDGHRLLLIDANRDREASLDGV